jgi:glutamate-5-semialdehyde dehydrogenase
VTLEDEMVGRLNSVREAARRLALAPTERKNAMLAKLADAIRSSSAEIIAVNRRDVEAAERAGSGKAFVERLTLNDQRVAAMARSVEEIAALPDPVGEIIEKWQRPNGLEIAKVRVPLGVIAIVYESRPNVTIDAAALTLKSGNGVVLRGGSEALKTNACLAQLVSDVLGAAGLPADAAFFVANPDREAIQFLKRQPALIDLIIPRGGQALKRALEGSAVPLLPHFDGICHTYVDRAADLAMAQEICFNAKCSRPSVCNAMENLLVHATIAREFLPAMARRFITEGVELRGCARTCEIVPDARPATETDWDTEYLDLILSIRIVDSLDEAIEFISRHGSHLADAIVTNDAQAATRFEREVDSATVYVNASTRFTDGFEFGFGAETGISTNRLHARGPMGLRELTTYKYVIHGRGQVRI